MKSGIESGTGFVYPEKLFIPSGLASHEPPLEVGVGAAEPCVARRVFYKLQQRPPPSGWAVAPNRRIRIRGDSRNQRIQRKG